MTFAIGVCQSLRILFHKMPADWFAAVAFTLRAVGQDNFEDVVVPDAQQQPPKTPNVQTNGIR